MTDTKATPATEPVCEWCGAYKSRHMDAYYYGFSATESPEVDRILCSVARAGKGAHHTESWDEYGFVQKIQDAAIACAARIAADAEIIKAARQERDSVKEALVEAREKLRAKDEEIERLTGVIMGATGEARATLTANILRHWTVESMAALAAKISNDDCRAELSTLRAQVETLREALAERDVLIKAMGEPLLFLATGQPQDNVSNGLKEQFVSALRQYESWIRRGRYGAATEPKG